MKPHLRCVRVVDCRERPVEIPFEDFARLPLRDILKPSSEYLIELTDSTGAILAATGSETLKIAMRMRPERAVHFHEILAILIPSWTDEMLDRSLCDLPLRKINNGNASEVLGRIQELARFHAEVVA